MTHRFKLSRRIARFRAPALAAAFLAFTACDTTNSLSPDASSLPQSTVQAGGADVIDINDTVDPDGASFAAPSFSSVSFAGGISFGLSAQPTTAYGFPYNGALRNIYPQYLMSHLAAIKSRGGKVVLNFSGNQKTFKDANGHFSMSKWQARVNRFKTLNLSSYINDGTIIGHFLMDEPNDPTNWNGQPVSQATVEAMAKYSKQIWPGLATIIRTYPDYLAKWSGTYHYLDAAWAQYVYRKGPVDDFIRTNVALAQKKGLGLVVGLNVIKGGPNKSKMTPTQVKTWGSALLSSSYPCAFLSWQYNDTYLSTSGIKTAMSYLRYKAQNRIAKSCKG